jgi:hypothetical protein
MGSIFYLVSVKNSCFFVTLNFSPPKSPARGLLWKAKISIYNPYKSPAGDATEYPEGWDLGCAHVNSEQKLIIIIEGWIRHNGAEFSVGY